MKTRLTVSLGGLALVLASLTPLFAKPNDHSTSVCCGTQSDCSSGETCCDPVDMGKEDCDPERPGYCRTSCLKGDGQPTRQAIEAPRSSSLLSK